MKALRVFDLEEVCQEVSGPPVKKLDKSFILDGAYGFQHAIEGILENAELDSDNEDLWQACEAGIVATLQSVNAVMKNLGIDFEIVEVDLVEYTAWMMVAKGQTPKLLIKQLKKAA
jgi:hypothetical protein